MNCDNDDKRRLFKLELSELWKSINIDHCSATNFVPYPSEEPREVQEGVTLKNNQNGTQLLSADKYMPDSDPCSSYGCGDAKGTNASSSASSGSSNRSDASHRRGLRHEDQYHYTPAKSNNSQFIHTDDNGYV